MLRSALGILLVVLDLTAGAALISIHPNQVSTSGSVHAYIECSTIDLREADVVMIGSSRANVLRAKSTAQSLVIMTPVLRPGVHDVIIRLHGHRLVCSSCIRASMLLVANVSFSESNPLVKSQLWGAAGDTLLAYITAEHLSHPASQLVATVSDSFASISGVHQLSPTRWQVHLSLPGLTAGRYVMTMVCDRAAAHESAAHGLLYDPATNEPAQTMVTIVPAIRGLRHHTTQDGRVQLELVGSGFSPVPETNTVRLGNRSCHVLRSDCGRIVCELTAASTVQPDALASDAASTSPAHAWGDRGMRLELSPLDSSRAMACVQRIGTAQLTLSALEDCAGMADGQDSQSIVRVPDALDFPKLDPLALDHDAFRRDTFVARGRATLLVPATGRYTLQSNCDEVKLRALCSLTLFAPLEGAGHASSHPLSLTDALLVVGVGYTLSWTFVHLAHGEHAYVSVKYACQDCANPLAVHTFHALPSSWLATPAKTRGALPIDNENDTDMRMNALVVQVGGIDAVCRTTRDCAEASIEVLSPFFNDATSVPLAHLLSAPLKYVSRGLRRLQSGERSFSSVRASGVCNNANVECTLPAGEVWELDVSMDVRTLTIEGTLKWADQVPLHCRGHEL